jgi:hypothetical protein
MKITDLSELLTLLSFVLGAFRSTPEGRKRRAGIRLQRNIEKHRKRRLKFAKEIRREASRDVITWIKYSALLADYDKAYPEPK